jgi:hypothetical protein
VHIFTIRHLDDDSDRQRHRFRVERQADGYCSDAAMLTAPAGIQVEGRPDSDFDKDLHWYLEQLPAYPSVPDIELAERVWETLHNWGKQTFAALFPSRADHLHISRKHSSN